MPIKSSQRGGPTLDRESISDDDITDIIEDGEDLEVENIAENESIRTKGQG